MTEWWTGRAMAFDLETDGTNPEDARIITACAAWIEPGQAPLVANWLAQPERDIPNEAAAVHGITTEVAREKGAPRENVVAGIAYALAQGGPDVDRHGDAPVVGHNVGSYDMTVLDREMRRLGIGSLAAVDDKVVVRVDGREIGSFHVIDTMVIDKGVDTYRPGPRDPETGEKLGGRNKLGPTSKFYGVPLSAEDAHAADADALAAARIARVMAKRANMKPTELHELYADRKRPSEMVVKFGWLRRLTLAELHAKQIEWAAEQAKGLAQYFRETGEGDPDTVNGEWPLRTYVADESER